MPQSRQSQVSLDLTPYYHCVSRCVRRAYLCGSDKLTGRSYTHRREWIVDRIGQLSHAFAIEVCAYAVMSNHFHIVARVDRDQALAWSDAEVIQRWSQLFSIPAIVRQYQSGSRLTHDKEETVNNIIALWRERLYSLSWFMRALNEPIARWANKEDDCTGRFWEGRFSSQALLDEAALLVAMAYVELNPVRAGEIKTPEKSKFTSLKKRITSLQKHKYKHNLMLFDISPFGATGTKRPRLTAFPPVSVVDYLELVDWCGRQIKQNKRGWISSAQPPVLQRLGIYPQQLARHMQSEDNGFFSTIGHLSSIRQAARVLGKKFLKGQGYAARLFTGQRYVIGI